ncbi:hypothetical protein ACFXD5_21600 [Streptomyces sp. NPDC059385]
MNRTKAREALPVHINTVVQRLERIGHLPNVSRFA